MEIRFEDIPQYHEWRKIEKIHYGWSSDEKFYIENRYGEKLLLRISSIDQLQAKEKEFRIIQKFNSLDFTISGAIDFGVCNHGQNVYMLLTWVQGDPLEEVICTFNDDFQFRLGVMAGKILKAMHNIKVDQEDIPKETKIAKKLYQLERYEKSSFRIPDDEYIIEYIKDNIHKTCQGAPVYLHGDFHLGNLIYTPEKAIGVIDFNRWECGDRFEEFYKVQSFDVEKSIPFAIGQIKGYFNGCPTDEFWEIQKVYVAHTSLYSIEWAVKYGQQDIDGMVKRCYSAIEDYDGFKLLIPKWYSENEQRYN